MKLHYGNEINVEDYNMLRDVVKWGALAEDQAQVGLDQSAFIVSCMDEGRIVGCARLIWDGGYVAYIADVIVLPEYQLQGIGHEMLSRIMEYLNSQLKPGWRIMVNLLAAKGKEGFYRKFNFIERPNESFGAGMFQWINKE